MELLLIYSYRLIFIVIDLMKKTTSPLLSRILLVISSIIVVVVVFYFVSRALKPLPMDNTLLINKTAEKFNVKADISKNETFQALKRVDDRLVDYNIGKKNPFVKTDFVKDVFTNSSEALENVSTSSSSTSTSTSNVKTYLERYNERMQKINNTPSSSIVNSTTHTTL